MVKVFESGTKSDAGERRIGRRPASAAVETVKVTSCSAGAAERGNVVDGAAFQRRRSSRALARLEVQGDGIAAS